jgi:hypothetical protein
LIDAVILPALVFIADPCDDLVCFDFITSEFGEVSAVGKFRGRRRKTGRSGSDGGLRRRSPPKK